MNTTAIDLRVTVLAFLLMQGSGFAQEDPAVKADTLYQAGNRQDAIPIYEQLAKANPNEPLYAERLAVCLYARSAGMDDGPERRALLDRISAQAKTALALGSKDDAAHVIATFDMASVSNEKGETLAKAISWSGEQYFGKHEFKEALRRYATAAELEPKVFEPSLYAGDAAQFMGDLPTAARWYERAIRNDPNYFKAYLHWGMAIESIAHDSSLAKAKYIDAVVANPYDPQGAQGLEKWAKAHGATLAAPQIKPPMAGMDMFKAMGQDPSSRSPWATYVLDRFTYETNAKGSTIGTFQQDHPAGGSPRRSLIGESRALRATALEAAAKAGKARKPDAEFRDLIEVDKAGMLECWVLMNGADKDIAQDYLEFSKTNWQLLHDYVDRFLIHEKANR